MEYNIKIRDTRQHKEQDKFVNCDAKRIVVKAGRRGGKTVGLAARAVRKLLERKRVLYGAPTIEQVDRYWHEVCRSLAVPIASGVLKKNETEHTIESPFTNSRIKAKTCWNANTLRGDYADELQLDEFQLMAEDTWEEVGVPMLLDNDGTAVFVFTPPSLGSSGVTKARDPRHASKFFRKAQEDKTGRWATFTFTSFDNPHISKDAIKDIAADMTPDAYRREIMAQDDEFEQSWLVYGNFNDSVCKIKRFNIPENWPIYVGHDFGKANPAALFLAQNPGTGEFFVWHEYTPGARSAHEHVKAFEEIIALPSGKKRNVIKRVGGNVTTEDEIRQAYTSHGWPITPPKIRKVNAQIDRVRGLMELNKIYIFDDLDGLLREIYNFMWVLDEDNKPTDKIKNEAQYHLLACLRYIASDFTPETVASDRVKVYRF